MSAAVVALALVAQATEFDDDFHMFALLVLPVAIFIGVARYIRIIDAPARGLLAAGSELSLFIGAVVTSAVVVLLTYASRRIIERGRRLLEPRFAR